MLHAIEEAQVPLLALMLLAGCTAKVLQMVRADSAAEQTGPTALFPRQLRGPLAIALCTIEGALGLGLIVTAFPFGEYAPATSFRIGTCMLFLVATCALIELRQSRPDASCGCFGDFSTAPVSGRALARSALLAVAGLATVWLGPVTVPRTAAGALGLLAILGTELLLVIALSPEVGEGLVRFGYSEPCEVRHVPAARTLAALRRSKYWRRYASLITSEVPTDTWRELCWRFIVYPGRYGGQPADVVFAVFLQHRRPIVHVALVDPATGAPLDWPAGKRGPLRPGRAALRHLAPHLPGGFTTVQARPTPFDLPFSTDI